MKLKYQFQAVDMVDEIIGVPTDESPNQPNGILRLNKEGLEILDLLKQDTTIEKIVDALAARYENPRDELLAYVTEVVEKLRSFGMLEG